MAESGTGPSESSGTKRPWTTLLSTLLAAALLCMAALWNGQPFFYPDTPTYLRGAEMGVARVVSPGSLKPWTPPEASSEAQTSAALPKPPAVQRLTSVEDKVVLAGRSVYYGALLYLSYLTGPGSSLWLAVWVQALCLAYLLQLAMVRVWGASNAQLLGATAALSLLTPMAVYTGFLMPDIFAAMLIVSVALLSTAWERLRAADRWALSGLLLYALMTHASHVVIAAVLLALLLLARWLWPAWRPNSHAGSHAGAGKALGVLAACLVLAVVAEAAFVKAVTQAVGTPPLRLPHPMARLIDAGPGTDFLKNNCPQANYAACAFVQNYPTAWTDFLFSSDRAKGAFAVADPATKRRLSDEQLRFVWDVTRADPLGVARVVGLDVLRQLGRFDTDIWSYGRDGVAQFYQGRVPPEALTQMQASRAARTTAYNIWFSLSNRIAVMAALVLLALAWFKQQQLFERSRFPAFASVVLAGVVINAAVCAGLASSMDRFQARVIWLLPFLAITGVLAWREQQRAVQVVSAQSEPGNPRPDPTADPKRSLASPLLGATP